jgi:hypothetical protein
MVRSAQFCALGHNETNALRLTEMDGAQERDAVRATIDRIDAASGDHRLLRRRGIRGEASRIAPRLVPRHPGPRVRQAEADQHRGKV